MSDGAHPLRRAAVLAASPEAGCERGVPDIDRLCQSHWKVAKHSHLQGTAGLSAVSLPHVHVDPLGVWNLAHGCYPW